MAEPTPIDPGLNGTRYEIQRILPRHFQMIDLHLAGLQNTQIAEIVGCTRETVGIILRSPLVVAEVQRRLKERNLSSKDQDVDSLVKQTKAILEQSATRAAKRTTELIESDDDSISLRASSSILDRILGTAKDRLPTGPAVSVTINATDAKLILTALTESKEF